MGLFSFIETFFFISLAITFILILLLVYHFKQRIISLENKAETMFEIVNSLVKEFTLLRMSQIVPTTMPSSSYSMHSMPSISSTYTVPNITTKILVSDESDVDDDEDEASDADNDSDVDDDDADDDAEEQEEQEQEQEEQEQEQEQEEQSVKVITMSMMSLDELPIDTILVEENEEEPALESLENLTESIVVDKLDEDLNGLLVEEGQEEEKEEDQEKKEDQEKEEDQEEKKEEEEKEQEEKEEKAEDKMEIYNKMSTAELKITVISKGLASDANKMRRPALLTLLGTATQ